MIFHFGGNSHACLLMESLSVTWQFYCWASQGDPAPGWGLLVKSQGGTLGCCVACQSALHWHCVVDLCQAGYVHKFHTAVWKLFQGNTKIQEILSETLTSWILFYIWFPSHFHKERITRAWVIGETQWGSDDLLSPLTSCAVFSLGKYAQPRMWTLTHFLPGDQKRRATI